MDFTSYQLFIVGMALVAHTAGAVAYISKVKNDLVTRVAVLESGHISTKMDLMEIKKDIKELLAWVHTEQGKK